MAFLQHADWKVELCTGSAVPDLKLITAEQLETSSAIKRGAEDILRRVLRPLESDLPTIQRQLAINVHERRRSLERVNGDYGDLRYEWWRTQHRHHHHACLGCVGCQRLCCFMREDNNTNTQCLNYGTLPHSSFMHVKWSKKCGTLHPHFLYLSPQTYSQNKFCKSTWHRADLLK
jgi:hypothetical protein